MIGKLGGEKNKGITGGEEKMSKMEKTISGIREEQMKGERLKEELRTKITYWKNKCEVAESDNKFLQKKTLETKKKNQLLKAAIARL